MVPLAIKSDLWLLVNSIAVGGVSLSFAETYLLAICHIASFMIVDWCGGFFPCSYRDSPPPSVSQLMFRFFKRLDWGGKDFAVSNRLSSFIQLPIISKTPLTDSGCRCYHLFRNFLYVTCLRFFNMEWRGCLTCLKLSTPSWGLSTWWWILPRTQRRLRTEFLNWLWCAIQGRLREKNESRR